MGAWGIGAFDNDTACDWSADLTDSGDLSFVEDTLTSVEEVEDDELDPHLACEAIAACEVVARLQGRGGRTEPHTVEVDRWIRTQPRRPSPALVKQATNALDRVVANSAELAVLWDDDAAWLSSVQDLRKRVAG